MTLHRAGASIQAIRSLVNSQDVRFYYTFNKTPIAEQFGPFQVEFNNGLHLLSVLLEV